MKHEKTVFKILKNLTAEQVSSDKRLKEDLGLDSLSLVSFIVEIEEAIGAEFDMTDLDPEKLITVKDIIALTKDIA